MSAPFTTAMAFCVHVEGRLGWCPPTHLGSRTKALVVEAAKVKRRIAADPANLTWDNLALTVDWLHGKHKEASPLAVCGNVQAALKATRRRSVAPPVDIVEAITKAIAVEQEQRRDGWEDWVRRLTRAQGPGREAVYQEWDGTRNENPG